MSESNIAEYVEEIDAALGADPTLKGDIFRGMRDTPMAEMARVRGGQVYKYRAYIAAIREGKIPAASTTAGQAASAVRGFLKRYTQSLSEGAQNELAGIAERCEEAARNPDRIEQEDEENKERNRKLAEKVGIYAYSYPHYLKYPYVKSEDGMTDDRTMIKVGMSAVGAKDRVFGQAAAMPEAPEILYIFTRVGAVEFLTHNDNNELLRKLEKQIHDHLRAIGHTRRSDTGGGKEWFLTNEATIESVANLLGLREDDQGDDI